MFPINMESVLFIFFSLSYAIAFYVNLYLHQTKRTQTYNDIYYDEEVGRFNILILKFPVTFFIIWTLFIFFLNWILIQIDIEPVQQFLFGAVIAAFSMQAGIEISGIIMFKHIINSSKEISDQVCLKKDHRLTILHHLALRIPVILLLVPLYAVHKTAFILGALCGTILPCLPLLISAVRTK